MLRAGKKNALVDIIEFTEVPDPVYNTPIYTAVPWRTDLFCHAVPRKGREVPMDGQIVSESFVRFEFDYYDVDGINSGMAIMHDGVMYDVKVIMADHATKLYTTIDAVVHGDGTERAS